MDVLDVMGDFGRYQKEVLAVLVLRSLLLSTAFYLVHVSAADVGHWCVPPEGFGNLSLMEWKECCLPKDHRGFDQCKRYEGTHLGDLDNTTLVDCYEWNYEKDVHTSIKSEWDLVCSRKWLLSNMYAVFNFGTLVSYPLAGYISDRIGRRAVILLGCAGLLITNTTLYFVTSLTWFMVFRALIGLPYAFLQGTSITYFLEITGRKQRPFILIFVGAAWGIFCIIHLGASVITSSWRTLVLIWSFPIALPYLAICWRFLPESPRWLIASGQPEKAKEVLILITKKNGILVQDMDSVIKDLKMKALGEDEQQNAAGVLELMRERRLFCIVCWITISCLVNSIVGSGYMIVLRGLGGNFHANFVLSQCTNFAASLLTTYVLSVITNRRKVLIAALAISGILYLIMTALGEDLQWLRIAVALVAKMLNTLSTQPLVILASEIFPTNFRARGYSICMTAGRLGTFCSSFVDLLSQSQGPNAPYFLFGGLCLLTAVVYLFIPDVDNKNLPDSVMETIRNLRNSNEQGTADTVPDVSYRAVPTA